VRSAGPGPGAVLDQFTHAELDTIARFITGVAHTLHEHIADLQSASGTGPARRPGSAR
jgi:hypothetical protein